MKTELELVSICVLNAGYAQVKENWVVTGCSSPFARLYFAKKGTAEIHLPNKVLNVKPGFMYIIPSFMEHSFKCEAGFEFYYLFVYERYGEQTDIFDIYSFPSEVEANHALDLLFENYCNYYPELNLPYHTAEEFYSHPAYREYVIRYTKMDRFEKMQLQGFIWIVASFFMKHGQKRLDDTDPRIIKVIAYIKDNVSREISLDTLAETACVTKSHLGRMFREKVGISPVQYIIRTKIQCAQRLLMTTGYSINSIAREVGFRDVSYFIRIFKQNIGFTPQEYRERLK